MHDLAAIRDNPDHYRAGLARKGAADRFDELLELEERRRTLIQEAEGLRARRNTAGESIAAAKKAGDDAAAAIEAMRELKVAEKEASTRLEETEAALGALVRLLPNLPDADVPDGPDESGNVEMHTWGGKPEFDFEPQPHWDLGERLGILDAATSGRMSGSGFTLLKGAGARLERALGQFLLDKATLEHGYTEISPPVLVRPESVDAVTIREKFGDDMYFIEKDELYLIPTAEHPLTNLHRDEILDAEELPLRYTALTPCFRREAGAAGRDTRGMLRVHQFWKVEMMSFCHPDRSGEEHERMRGNAEACLQALGLPYRCVFVCTGDMSAANQRQYDLEVWAAGVGKWLEVSSISNFGSWQARRAGTRCREGQDKPRTVHTLNGSALGMPRVLIALMENYQRPDGTIAVPAALRDRMGGVEVIGA